MTRGRAVPAAGFAAFDIECQDWDRFVVGALRRADGEVIIERDEDRLFDALLDTEGDVWTWAGGRYDMVWAAEVAARRQIHVQARSSGGAPVALQIGRCTLRDGYRLFPESLRSASQLAGAGASMKSTTGLACRGGHSDGADCGGYCAIRRDMSSEEWAHVERYLVADVEATAATIAALHGEAARLGITLKNTVGASAWATLRAMGAPEAEWQSWRDYHHARAGYYGGRVELYRAHAPRVWRADLNSAYPAALVAQAVPCGAYERLAGDAAGRAYRAGRPGVYHATVTVAPAHCPPLPSRADDRLVFVHGPNVGAWTRDELGHAEECGARVEVIGSAIVWEREETIAREFCERYWGERHAAGKKSALGRWLKWFCNSLTGKFAMRPEGERMHVGVDRGEVRVCPASGSCHHRGAGLGPFCGKIGACCRHLCTGRCKAWTSVGRAQLLWLAPEWHLDACAHVQWAAVLTATTRVEWHRQALSVGDDLAYGDTDSIYAARPITRRLGDELGEWADEGSASEWAARGPKAYRYTDDSTGALVTRSKGVPRLSRLDRGELAWDRWARGESVEIQGGVWGIKGGALRGDLFAAKRGADGGAYCRSAQSDPTLAGSREVLPDGTTRTLTRAEFDARVATQKEK